jgi:hypothetical protein
MAHKFVPVKVCRNRAQDAVRGRKGSHEASLQPFARSDRTSPTPSGPGFRGASKQGGDAQRPFPVGYTQRPVGRGIRPDGDKIGD